MFSFLKKNPPASPDAKPGDQDAKPGNGWIARLKSGLARTGSQLTGLFGRGGKIDDDLYEELETILITADVGMDATNALLADLRRYVREHHLSEAAQLKEALAHCLLKLLKPLAQPLQAETHKPFVIMLCGVNGAGKTTSIGKLAKYLQSQGLSVLLAAGDTFRAAAREQLAEWGARNNVTVIAQQGGDAAAVIYDSIQSAQARKIDVVLADTAGRLTTQAHLMEEIKKVKRVIAKALPEAPHEVLLVLDANTGQNALSQVKAFDQALGVTGLILTKLDGTAKGGVIAAIARAHPIPVRFIGVGEGLDDLRPFVAEDFVAALLGLDE
ncbi:MAG: signal recognition particle-docking protein FtsY [Gallionella sp.]|nr:signal recognition particle-docking protein FtsY [Gallionella sp.]